jgi:hypothetical protein
MKEVVQGALARLGVTSDEKWAAAKNLEELSTFIAGAAKEINLAKLAKEARAILEQLAKYYPEIEMKIRHAEVDTALRSSAELRRLIDKFKAELKTNADREKTQGMTLANLRKELQNIIDQLAKFYKSTTIDDLRAAAIMNGNNEGWLRKEIARLGGELSKEVELARDRRHLETEAEKLRKAEERAAEAPFGEDRAHGRHGR